VDPGTDGPLVVVGGDAAGMSAAAEARRCDPRRPVVVLERSEHVSYAACGFPYWLGGLVDERDDLVAHDAAYFRERRGIDVRLGHEVAAVDPEARRVELAGGGRVPYGVLVLATGARPALPDVPGTDLPGVHALRDMSSAIALGAALDRLEGGGSALLVGCGPIGLEMAENLCRRGLRIHLIEAADQLAPALHPDVAAPVAHALREGCATSRVDVDLSALRPAPAGRVEAVVDGVPEVHDLVLLATGIVPNAGIGAAAGCRTGPRGALAVDRACRTSVPGILAAGDCATAWHRILERDVWQPLATTANRQGRVAGRTACGREDLFPGILGSWVSEAFGVTFGVTGLDEPAAAEAGFRPTAVARTGRDRSGYMPGATEVCVRLVYDAPTGRLLGGQTAGGRDSANRLRALAVALTARLTVGELAGVDAAYAPPVSALRDPLELAAAAAVGDAP
jgi:CoA-dependent NAD(P)H sulfur oxidoreductase